jgi:alpha-ketoglutarate-dependent taurine dioxygenase
MDARDPAGLHTALCMLRDYGFVCLEGVPATMEATEQASRRVSFLRETLYGPGMWRTEVRAGGGNDTAYTGIPLPVHNDGCYWADPPGIQSFHCLQGAPAGGGTSILVDGLAVAAALRSQDPDAFDFFASVELPYHHTDPDAEVSQRRPVIGVDRATGELASFAFNNDDRAPLRLSPPSRVPQFYKHLRTLTSLLRSPAFELRLSLQPGTYLIFDNTRVLHGRTGFKTDSGRVLAGCYIGKEDWHARLRTVARAMGKYTPSVTLQPPAPPAAPTPPVAQ